MKDVKKSHELTTEILGCESEIESLTYRIEEIEKEGSKVEAMLELEINNNRRGRKRYYLNKEQVLPILKAGLESSKERLLSFQKQYAAL
jgi:hypothetical protein